MIKMVYAWRDRAELGAERCEEHYRTVHAELARGVYEGFPGFVALTYNRVREARVNDENEAVSHAVTPDFDAFIELWFEDQASFDAALSQPGLDRMFVDHANFMETDIPANIRIYDVDETLVVGRLVLDDQG